MLRARPARGRAGSGSRSRPPDAAPGLVLGGIVGAGRPEGCHGSATRADAGKEVRENRANGAENAEPPVGFEPTTARLRIESSTTELRWRGYAATTYRIGREVYAVVPMVVPKPAPRSASNRVPNLVVCCSTRYSTASARWRTWSKCPYTFRTIASPLVRRSSSRGFRSRPASRSGALGPSHGRVSKNGTT